MPAKALLCRGNDDPRPRKALCQGRWWVGRRLRQRKRQKAYRGTIVSALSNQFALRKKRLDEPPIELKRTIQRRFAAGRVTPRPTGFGQQQP